MTFVHTNDHAMGNLGYARREADHYPTPAWVSAAIIPWLRYHHVSADTPVWEPACGNGAMAKVLKREFNDVTATDLHDHGFGRKNADFLRQDLHWRGAIITNPPYGDRAEQFIRHALKLTARHQGVVAMLLRNEYDSAKERVDLFRRPPFARKLVLTSRPRWIEGSTGAPRHNYSWFVLDHKHNGEPVISWHVRIA